MAYNMDLLDKFDSNIYLSVEDILNHNKCGIRIEMDANEPRIRDLHISVQSIDDTLKSQTLKMSQKFKRTSQMYKLEKFVKHESDFIRAKRTINNGIEKFTTKVQDKEFLKRHLKKRIPAIDWIPKYSLKSHLLGDVIAGFTAGIMNIPQGMAYSLLATLPPVNGLYISFFPLLVYTFLGTSRHLAIGAIAVVSLLSGGVMDRLSDSYEYTPLTNNGTIVNDTASEIAIREKYRVAVACSLSLLVGLIQAIMGFSGLGIITSYFSDTFISSYTSGSAIHVLTSQIKDLFGMKGTTKFEGLFKIPKTIINLLANIPNSNWKTILISLAGIVYLIIFKEFLNPRIKKKIKIEFPSELILVIIMTAISYATKFNQNLGIDIVKTIPRGLPAPIAPDISIWPQIFQDGIIIAVIGFSINVSLATLFARKHRYKIDSTQELYAYSGSNIFSSFFSCFPCAASLSRSSVLEAANSKTQAASLFSSLVIIVVIVWIGPLFEPLPKACLACIIVVALKGLLFQIRDLFKLWRINKFEFVTWLITYLGVVLLDVDIGLIIGLGISIFTVVVRDQFLRFRSQVKSNDPSLSYIDESFIKQENIASSTNLELNFKTIRNFRVFKVQNSIYFVNCESFLKKLYKLYGTSPFDDCDKVQKNMNLARSEKTNLQSDDSQIGLSDDDNELNKQYLTDQCLILDLSAVNYVDTNGIKMLLQLIKDYQKVNVNVYLCNPQDHFIKMAYNMELLDAFDDNIYLKIEDILKQINEKYLAEF